MTQPDSTTAAAVPRLRSGTAARLAGMPVATLRVWERRYGVVAATRSASGQRLYTPQDVERLRLIRALTAAGHAIGTVAPLALADLQSLAGERPPRRQRVVVVGRAAAQKLTTAGTEPVAVHDDVAAAEAAADAPAGADGGCDALVAHLPSLQPALADRVVALAARWRAPVLVVVYAFGAESVAASLRAAGATVCREPASGRELAALVARGGAGRGDAAPALRVAPAPPALPVRPRRYSDEALSALTESPTPVPCECPRHVAEIIVQLAGFERYSADCGADSPGDADFHRRLNAAAGAARTLFEDALAQLAAADGIDLPEIPR